MSASQRPQRECSDLVVGHDVRSAGPNDSSPRRLQIRALLPQPFGFDRLHLSAPSARRKQRPSRASPVKCHDTRVFFSKLRSGVLAESRQPLNRSSRRESALTLLWIRWSGLTSTATKFMGSQCLQARTPRPSPLPVWAGRGSCLRSVRVSKCAPTQSPAQVQLGFSTN
jgi:hypothetical protein